MTNNRDIPAEALAMAGRLEAWAPLIASGYEFPVDLMILEEAAALLREMAEMLAQRNER